MGVHLKQCRVALRIGGQCVAALGQCVELQQFLHCEHGRYGEQQQCEQFAWLRPGSHEPADGGWVAKVTIIGEAMTLRERRCASRGLERDPKSPSDGYGRTLTCMAGQRRHCSVSCPRSTQLEHAPTIRLYGGPQYDKRGAPRGAVPAA